MYEKLQKEEADLLAMAAGDPSLKEMADADFGYVGSGPQKVNLFVGKECVERNVPEAEADSRLVELIKRHNKWVEPEAV